MKRGDKTPDDLSRPDGNSLEENYQLHDKAEQIVAQRIEVTDFRLEPWGIDMRGDDGEGGIIYDDKMDFKVFDADDNLVGIMDVKSKSDHKYMGTFNKRHYDHYADWSEELGVPTFVVMFHIANDNVQDEFAFEVHKSGWVHDSDGAAVDNFPDGNNAVLIPHDQRTDWREVMQKINWQANGQ